MAPDGFHGAYEVLEITEAYRATGAMDEPDLKGNLAKQVMGQKARILWIVIHGASVINGFQQR